jgi:hypothetical protein
MIPESQAADLVDQRVVVTSIKEGWSGPEVKLGNAGVLLRVSGQWADVHFDGNEEHDYTMCHLEELSVEETKKSRK